MYKHIITYDRGDFNICRLDNEYSNGTTIATCTKQRKFGGEISLSLKEAKENAVKILQLFDPDAQPDIFKTDGTTKIMDFKPCFKCGRPDQPVTELNKGTSYCELCIQKLLSFCDKETLR